MGNVVNLRTHRKRVAKQNDERRAAENRHLHGMTKAEKLARRADAERESARLDVHRLEPRDDTR